MKVMEGILRNQNIKLVEAENFASRQGIQTKRMNSFCGTSFPLPDALWKMRFPPTLTPPFTKPVNTAFIHCLVNTYRFDFNSIYSYSYLNVIVH